MVILVKNLRIFKLLENIIEFQPVFESFYLEFLRLSSYRIISRSVNMIILRAQSYSEV